MITTSEQSAPRRPIPVEAVALLLAPIFWLAGVDFIIYGVLVLIAWAFRPVSGNWSQPELALLALILILAFSSIVAAVALSADMAELGSALYSLFLWTAGLIILRRFRQFSKTSPTPLEHTFRNASRLFPILVLMTILGPLLYVITGNLLHSPSAIGMVISTDLPGIASASQELTWVRLDWINNVAVPRALAMAPYANAAGITILIVGMWTLMHLSLTRRATMGSQLLKFLVMLLILSGVVLTGSRSLLLGIMLGIIVTGLLFLKIAKRTLLILLLASALLVLPVNSYLTEIIFLRADSNNTRISNYSEAYTMVAAINPIAGIGVKPKLDTSTIAIGSHSTPVSIFTKGGILGLILATYVIILAPMLILLSMRRKLEQLNVPRRSPLVRVIKYLWITQITVSVFYAFEDIDVAAFASFVTFLHLGILYSMPSMLRYYGRQQSYLSPGDGLVLRAPLDPITPSQSFSSH